MAIGKRITAPYTGTFDPTGQFVTSWILPPGVLFVIRALLSLYAFTTLFTIFGWNSSHDMAEASRRSFSYFTHLTYWGLAFYHAFSALHTGSYWLTETSFLARWPKALQVAHSMFYSTVVVYPWIVTAVYWGILSPGKFPSSFSLWSNTSQHALNSFYALFEIVFPRTQPLPWLDLIPVVILLAGFLDLREHSSGIVTAYIIGILVAAIIIFLIVRYVILLRVWITEKILHMSGKFSSRGRPRLPSHQSEKGLPLHHMSTNTN